MTEPFLKDADCALYCGDVLDTLRELPDESVHMVCTSPPFYGLRDYGTGAWEGGDEGCDHLRPPNAPDPSSTLRGAGRNTHQNHAREPWPNNTCGKCGARRADRQIGLEATPDLWVARLVEVFREVRRVLRNDATLWIELGDSFDNKQLVGQPFRLGLALQSDGWIWRGVYIWDKANAMPESVRDRCSSAHSYVLHMAKTRNYYFDQEAIREPHSPDGRVVTTVVGREGSLQHRDGERWPGSGRPSAETPSGSVRSDTCTCDYTDHFAVWPQKLVEPMILAGTSERGVCPECGAQWERVVEAERIRPAAASGNREVGPRGTFTETEVGGRRVVTPVGWRPGCACFPGCICHWDGTRTVYWSCPVHYRGTHRPRYPEPVPATVLDPFAGSGTTLHVARRLGRHSIGVELNPDYCKLAARRLAQQSLLV